MDGVNELWIQTIIVWANQEPLIEAVYIYGSRARGSHRQNSDLDVAVIVGGSDDEERLANALSEDRRWVAALQSRLPVKLHFEWAIGHDGIVATAIRDHGCLVYDRRRKHGM